MPYFTSFELLPQSNKNNPKYVKINRYDDKSIEAFSNDLRSFINLQNFNSDLITNPNVTYNLIEESIKKSADIHLEPKIVRFRRRKHKLNPWITKGILKSIAHKDYLYKKLNLTERNSPEFDNLSTNLRTYQAILRKNIKLAKINYYGKEFEQCKDNIKRTWKKINELLNKCKNKKEFPEYFLINNDKVKDKNLIANGFNKFFANIGPDLSSKITTNSNNTIKTYMTKRIACSFKFSTVNTDDVIKIGMKLKTKTSTGYDNMSTSLLKKILPLIIHPLTLAINQSLCTGVFPDHLKIAKVIPLYKKDDSHILDNYRPISLLPCMSKLFEKVAFLQLYEYFNSNHLLYKSQYGFRSLYSTELACAEMTDRIHKHLDESKIPISVFLDLSKAFDTLDHEILLTKLKYYGLNENALNWFQSYLSNRIQYVEFDGCKSSYLPVTTGVPQGSVLGHLLFIIYMNDIYCASDKFNSILFADDTHLLSTLCSFDMSINQNTDLSVLSKYINSELQKIHTWLAINKLSLNVKKTKYMIFHHKRRNIENMIPQLQIDNYKLERVREFNFLGLLVDENLTWDSHIQKVSNKVSRILGVMY